MSNALDHTKPAENNSSGISQVLLLYGVSFALLVFIGGPLQQFSFKFGLMVCLVLLILVPALVFIRSKGIGLVQGLRLRAVRPSITLWSFFLGLGTWGVGYSIALALDALGLKTLNQGIDIGLDSLGAYLISLLVVAVGPGICEESLFRGVIQGVLERKGKWFAVIVTGVLFGLFHMALGIAIPAFILGSIYGWVLIRTGSILPAMVAHFANNAMALSFVYFLNGEDPGWLLPCLFLIGVIAVVAIMRLSSADQVSIAGSPLSEVPAGLPYMGSLGCVVPLMAFMVMIVGFTSALPYLIQIEELDGGKQVIYAGQDSLFFEPMLEREDARVLYDRGGKSEIGRILERTDDMIEVRDKEGNEIEIPTADVKGVVLHL